MDYEIILITLLLLFSGSSFSQNEDNHWLFSTYGALDFNSGLPVPFDASGSIDTDEGSASISDLNGDLLFFTDGSTVWNSNQEIMPNGTGLGGHSSSTQSALIIKKPNDNSIYYLFTTDAVGGPNGMRYSEVDITLDGGLGDINATKNLLIENTTTEKLVAVLHQNGTDIWVLTQKAGSNIYHSYLVTADGVNMTPIISSVGEELSNFTTAGAGYLKASPNGLKIANAKSVDGAVDILDFDNATGMLSNVKTIIVSIPYGIEFSSNNSVLYVSTHGIYENGIHQFDLSLCDQADIQATDTHLDGSGGVHSLLIGPDKRIYVSTFVHNYLYVIENPNNLGLTCNLLVDEVDLMAGDGSGFTIYGLPNFQNSWKYNHHYYTICQNDSIALVDFNNSTHNWVLESDDLTILSTDSIYFASPDFTTTYIEFDDSDTVFYTINVRDSPGIAGIFIGNDTTLCPGESLYLFETGSENSFLWQNGSTDTSFTVYEPGTYWLKVTNENCCSSTDTIQVDHIIDLTVDVDEATMTANAIADSYQWVDCDDSYEIIIGETDQSFTATTVGSYAVIITIDDCVDTSACVEILGFSSIDEPKDEILHYFPNPTTGNVTLVLNDHTQIKEIRIISLEGKVINNYSAKKEQLNIQLPSASGLYFLQLIDNDNTVFTYKIVKK